MGACPGHNAKQDKNLRRTCAELKEGASSPWSTDQRLSPGEKRTSSAKPIRRAKLWRTSSSFVELWRTANSKELEEPRVRGK